MGSALSRTANWLNSGLKDRITHEDVMDKRGYFVPQFARDEVALHNHKLLHTIGSRNACCWLTTTLGILAVGMVLLVGMRDDMPEPFPPTSSPTTLTPTFAPTYLPTAAPTSDPTSAPSSSPSMSPTIACADKECSSQADCDDHAGCDNLGHWKICIPDADAGKGLCNDDAYQHANDCLGHNDHHTQSFDVGGDKFQHRSTALCYIDSDCSGRTGVVVPSLGGGGTCTCPSNQELACTEKTLTNGNAPSLNTSVKFCA